MNISSIGHVGPTFITSRFRCPDYACRFWQGHFDYWSWSFYLYSHIMKIKSLSHLRKCPWPIALQLVITPRFSFCSICVLLCVCVCLSMHDSSDISCLINSKSGALSNLFWECTVSLFGPPLLKTSCPLSTVHGKFNTFSWESQKDSCLTSHFIILEHSIEK